MRDVLKTALRGGFHERLAAEGYRRSGHTWRLHDDERVRLIQAQPSQWNSADAGSFTLNLGIYDSRLQRLVERSGWHAPKGRQPVAYNCAIQTRIGPLMKLPRGQVDHWWDITRETSPEALSEELVEVLDRLALPWLKKAVNYRYALRHSDFGAGSLAGTAMQQLIDRERNVKR
jgi:hypothetical protein